MDIPSNITAQYLQDGTNFYSFYQKTEIQPEKNPSTTSETVKFVFTISPNLYINTQTVCLEANITVADNSLEGCNLILDGSSQSLISELKIESNAQPIEHITRYDIVASQLEHMGIGPMSKQHRYYFGFVEDPTKSTFLDQESAQWNNTQKEISDIRAINGITTNYTAQVCGGSTLAFMPFDLLPKQIINRALNTSTGTGNVVGQVDDNGYFETGTGIGAGSAAYDIYWGQPLGYFSFRKGNGEADVQLYAPVQNDTNKLGVRDRLYQCRLPNFETNSSNNPLTTEFQAGKHHRGFVSTKQLHVQAFGVLDFRRHRIEAVSNILNGDGGIQGPHSELLVNHVSTEQMFQQKIPGSTTLQTAKNCKVGVVKESSWANQFDNSGKSFAATTDNCATFGYQCIGSNFTTKFSRNLELSSEHYTHWLKNGNVLTKPVRQKYLKLLVPLNSAILGQMNGKFLPGSCLGRMVVYITLNRHAFYLSGISKYYDGQTLSSKQQILDAMVGRNWTFQSLKLTMESYRYGEAQHEALQQKLVNGILNNNLQATPAGEYTISNTQMLQQNWNLTVRQPAVRMITMAIYSNDYQTYTFRRKLGRLSGNITKLRMRITDTYLPQEYITGNAGNPVQFDDNGDDNMNFIIWLHKSLQTFKDNTTSSPFNNINFAINDSAFNPDPFTYPSSDITTVASATKQLSYGQPGVFEQNYYGMALYIWAFGQLPMMPQANVGLDTRNLDIFSVEIGVDSTIAGNIRPQTLIFTAYADFIFKVYQRNIIVMGK